MDTTVRLAVIGDPHLRADHLIPSRKLVTALIKKCQELQPDAIVVLGDTLHTHDTVKLSALSLVDVFFKALKKIAPLIVLIGNHDIMHNQVFLPDSETPEHPFLFLKEWPNTTVCDRATLFDVGGFTFCGVPYVPPGRYTETIKDVPIEKVTAFFSHQEFLDVRARLSEEGSQKGDPWPDNNCMNVCGHFHVAQIVKKNLIYVGTPQQQDFGEDENKAIGVFTFSKEPFEGCECHNGVYYQYTRHGLVGTIKRREYNIQVGEVNTLREILDFVNSDEDYLVKIKVNGSANETAALKRNKIYKELDSHKRVTIDTIGGALQKDPEGRKLVRKTFMDFLNEKLEADPEAKERFKQSFS